MGTQQLSGLNWDADTKYTAAYYGNLGEGTNGWYMYVRALNDGIVPLGKAADASTPTGNGNVIQLLKAIREIAKREDDTHASLDYGFPAWGVVNEGIVSGRANGDYGPIALGQGGEQMQTPVPPQTATTAAAVALSSASSTAAAASLVIKASAGTLYKLTVLNTNAAAQYILLHNTTSLPADGQVPAIALKVPALDSRDFYWPQFGRRFTTGITVVNSSTFATKTIGAADCFFSAEYK